MGASKLTHETLDNTVEMQSVIETILGEVEKIIGGDRHFIDKKHGPVELDPPGQIIAVDGWHILLSGLLINY